MKRLLLAVIGLGLLAGCRDKPLPPAESKPRFLGSQQCAGCHQPQFEGWTQSHHYKAMQAPTDDTVLGDFNDAQFDYYGIKSKFYRKGAEFWVTTDGPQGTSQSYRIEYTFGVEPLQQYLIKFPDGRLQALSICWDTKKKQWFHLHPEQKIDHTNPRHWTGSQWNWNFMCAECHSTNVKKGYDPTGNTFHTTFDEINVSCESCHGPGSQHLDFLKGKSLPNKGFPVSLKSRGPWQPQTASTPPKPQNPDTVTAQVETCARCHSRRTQISEAYRHGEPLGQTHSVSVLQEGLYHADGQIDDEVYVYGSFLQSKMYHAGVVCTDCHDPHTYKLRLPGDQQCLSCHSADHQSPQHSHHNDVSCLDCHMPGKYYMLKDYRRDHSFRIPRPDISQEMGSPNACNTCHTDKSVEWAKDAFVKWYGKGKPHFGQAFHLARQRNSKGLAAAGEIALDPSYPEIVRATAVSLAPSPEVLEAALKDQSSLMRREALTALIGTPPEVRAQLAGPLARDPVREVRLQAGRLLADLEAEDPDWKKAVEEYRESLVFQSDRVESGAGLLDLLAAQHKTAEAQTALEQLLKEFPRSPLPYINGADFYRAQIQEDKVESLLRQGLSQVSPEQTAPIAHSLGLSLVRQGRRQEALVQLKRACELAPEERRYGYVYAVALEEQGQTAQALSELERLLKHRPQDTELLEMSSLLQQKL